LDELLRHDGLSDSLDQGHCISCKKICGLYKCKDCFSGSLLRCRDCVVDAHRDHPFHRVEIWNGLFFTAVTLQSLGLRVQLGHGGAPCPLPSAGPENFCIFDTSGVHYISVDFCDCRTNGFILVFWQLQLKPAPESAKMLAEPRHMSPSSQVEAIESRHKPAPHHPLPL
ncbi:hypothetical protein F5888DRAFT_1617493, partial [Russula emetica]